MPSASVLDVSTRFECALTLDSDIANARYVSGKREEALRRLGIETLGDLLLHVPYRYLDFSVRYSVESAPIGCSCSIVGTIYRISTRPHARVHVTYITVADETGLVEAVFFRQPWLARQYAEGECVAISGKVEFDRGFKKMISPIMERWDDSTQAAPILPVHYVSEGLSVGWMRRIVSAAIAQAGNFADPIPVSLRAERKLMSAHAAQRSIHFPQSMGERELARRRLAYEELLLLQLALRLREGSALVDVSPRAHTPGFFVDRMREALPWSLSAEQDAAVGDILNDMADGSRVMNRLLMGDVGCGKTAVATFALAACADTGTQACVMAPTSVLAQQYATGSGPLLERAGILWALVTGATPRAERARICEGLAAGTIQVLFGTQAVLSDDIQFSDLSLAVIDEQHRFGVDQRAALRRKGTGVDLLVMTATPIPRTLALSVYGDLDTSVIRHRPVAGAGVETKVLTEGSRDIAYGAIREAIAAGRQAYVICPLVTSADALDELEDVPGTRRAEDGSIEVPAPPHDAVAEAKAIECAFPGACVGLLHGRMAPAEKERVLERFRSGEVQILVSTTVVEVGVDVPNATVMLIEDAERFGLATLHQLRGRVGRGELSGTCYLLTHAKSDGGASSAQERLSALEKSSDGFALAEMDLRLRHEGEILGYRQSGGVTLRFVDLEGDADLIEAAHDDADELLRYASALDSPDTLPLRHEVIRRYGDVMKEVSGG